MGLKFANFFGTVRLVARLNAIVISRMKKILTVQNW